MQIFHVSHIGEFHVNHNEDYHIISPIGESKTLIAVMDGCSSGTDSYFASTLIGKLLRKIANQEAYLEFRTKSQKNAKDLLHSICIQLFEDLKLANHLIDLKSDEILSTLILGIVDDISQSCELVIVGDGVIHHDGKTIEFENDNKPDYLGYYLQMDKNLWFQTKTKQLSIRRFKDLSISTDGIHTFKNFDGKDYPKINESAIFYKFFESLVHINSENKLKKSLISMKNEYGLHPSDDFTIIRVIL